MSKFLLHGRLTITKSAVRYKMIGNSIFALNFFPFLPSLQINILEMIFFSFYTIAKLRGKCWGSLSRFLSNSLYLFLSLTIYYFCLFLNITAATFCHAILLPRTQGHTRNPNLLWRHINRSYHLFIAEVNRRYHFYLTYLTKLIQQEIMSIFCQFIFKYFAFSHCI